MIGTVQARPHLFRILLALTLILVIGTAGYHWIEDWPLSDSLYMVMITISTVGYGETHPLSAEGRLFTMFLLVAGVGLVTYAVGTITRMIVEGEIQTLMGRRRTMSKIRRLKDHYVICGFGRIGSMVCKEFARRPVPFVVVERDEAKVVKIPPEYPVVVGDSTEEDVLLSAGVDRARGLVTVLHSDADNLFITLTARDLNPKLNIIARYEEEKSEGKLLRAGADKVISPYIIGGTRVAMAVLRPAVIDFIELTTQSESLGLQMEEILLQPGSPLVGAALVDTDIRAKLDIIIVAIKKRSGHMEFNPSAQTVLEEGDRLIAIGERDDLLQLEANAKGIAAGA